MPIVQDLRHLPRWPRGDLLGLERFLRFSLGWLWLRAHPGDCSPQGVGPGVWRSLLVLLVLLLQDGQDQQQLRRPNGADQQSKQSNKSNEI
jgi:hypothetical protein